MKWIKKILILVVSVLSVIGGVPGIISTYEYLNKGPDLNINLEFISMGELDSWDLSNENVKIHKKKSLYLLLALSINNLGNQPLTPWSYSLSVKTDMWFDFYSLQIPDDIDTIQSDEFIFDFGESPPYKNDLGKITQYKPNDPTAGYLMFANDKLLNYHLFDTPEKFELIIYDEKLKKYYFTFYPSDLNFDERKVVFYPRLNATRTRIK